MDAFQAFVHEFSRYGYPVLVAGVLLENIGIPVPGETAVLIAGFLSSPAGGSHFDIVLVIVLTSFAAIVGDQIGFFLGHSWARRRLQSGRRFLFLTPKALNLAEKYFQRYGVWTIFFARFITGLRVVGALAAGTAGMHWLHFSLANAGGALSWAVTMSLLGYFFGHSWDLLHKVIGRGGMVLLGCLIVLVGLSYLWRHLKERSPLIERLTRAQLWHGFLVAIMEIVCIALLMLVSGKEEPTHVDRVIEEWVTSTATKLPLINDVAFTCRLVGTLPVTTVAAVIMAAVVWSRDRRKRKIAVLAWAVVASEMIGLALLGLLHVENIDPERLIARPLGFAGIVPLRTFAVFGTIAYLIAAQNRRAGQAAYVVGSLLVVLTAWSLIWRLDQRFTEVLLELTAGGIILFGGIWWLEGYGPGLRPVPPREPPEGSPVAAPEVK